MSDNKTNIDPRYLKYNKDEVEDILDHAVQISEESDPMSLVNNP
jgi:hypothetical protein